LSEFYIEQEKIYFWGQNSENKPSEPKNGFGLQNQYDRVTYPSIENFINNVLLGVKKAKKGPQTPKTEFGAQIQYGRVMYPSMGNFE
jgi:hypothetical protein